MYRRTDLANGLRVVTHDMKERDSLSLGFWIAVGGRYEEDPVKGVSHFLEHISFKGSKKYSCNEIKELIEGVGGSLNAFTSEEQTCYYAKIPSKHLAQTFDVLADMVFYPMINQEDVVKESTVIVEELKMYRDQPHYFVLELVDELLWPGHPLGKHLVGTPETVSAMTAAKLREFHSTYYVPKNIVVSVSGCVKHEKIVSLVQKKIGKVNLEGKSNYLPADNSQLKSRLRLFKKDTEQMHLALAAIGFDEHHKDRYALSLLSTILGGNMSSRLFNELREKRGLAYSISSSSKSLHDTGVFLIRGGVDNKKLVESLELIFKELDKIKQEGVTKGEFMRAKDYLSGQILLGLEDTMDHMLWIGETIASKNKFETLENIIQQFNKIKKDDIRRIAQQVLQENRFNLAVVGPVTESLENNLKSLMENGVK